MSMIRTACLWAEYILYSFLPKLYGFSSERTTFLPNSEISSGLFYVLSDPKYRTLERDLSYPKNVPTISPLSEIRRRRSSGRLRKRGLDVYNFSSELENLCGWRLNCPDHIQLSEKWREQGCEVTANRGANLLRSEDQFRLVLGTATSRGPLRCFPAARAPRFLSRRG